MTSKSLAAALCVLLWAVAAPGARSIRAAATTIWDVRDTSQPGQLSIYNSDFDGSTLGMPCGSGDLDGDGFDDVVLAPFMAPAGPANDRLRAGKLHVYFGHSGAISGLIDQRDNPSGAVTIYGARSGDNLGNEVDVADVTGDGLGDILGCAQTADGFGTDSSRVGAGALYVIKGRQTWPSTIDLAADSDGVTEILGARAGERCGFWAAAGDVDGDGVKDILVSADLAPGSNGQGTARGKLYIIPGGPNLPARIDLADAQQIASLKIAVVYGVDDCDHFGSCITSADFDGDGIDDVVCSAGVARSGAINTGKTTDAFCSAVQGGGGGPNNDRPEAGEVYVIYGRRTWPATIQLSTPPPDVAIYYGQRAADHFGEDVHAGDFDGDGIPELAVGALTASAPDPDRVPSIRERSGVGYIFWGNLLQKGERLDTATFGSVQTRFVRLYGEAPQDIGADTIALVDIDGDGLSEVIFASPTYDPKGPLDPAPRSNAGDVKIIFGSRDRLPPVVDFKNPPDGVPVYRFIAADPGDMFAYSLTTGDFNGDGVTDLMPNGMGGDGFGNCCRDAGELYVLSGREIRTRAGRSPAPPPCVSRVTVAPTASRYYAGQSGIEISVFCDSADTGVQFQEGATILLNGVEVTTQFVSSHQLTARLDDAPGVRNVGGPVSVQVRNPGGDPSEATVALTLVGPEISSVTAKTKAGAIKLNVSGANFLAGATVVVTNAVGDQVQVTKVTRKSSKKLNATLASGAAGSGATLTVRVVNPGPAPSAPATVLVP